MPQNSSSDSEISYPTCRLYEALSWVGLHWVGLDWLGWIGWVGLGFVGLGLGWPGLGWLGPFLAMLFWMQKTEHEQLQT